MELVGMSINQEDASQRCTSRIEFGTLTLTSSLYRTIQWDLVPGRG